MEKLLAIAEEIIDRIYDLKINDEILNDKMMEFHLMEEKMRTNLIEKQQRDELLLSYSNLLRSMAQHPTHSLCLRGPIGEAWGEHKRAVLQILTRHDLQI